MDQLQEKLKDLRDIHEPVPISNWPIAPGWWLLCVLLIILMVLLIVWFKKSKTPKFKKLAYQELKNISTNYEIKGDGHKTAGEIALLIRKVLVAKDAHQEVAGLIDEEWLIYLDKKSRSNLFTSGPGRVLTTVVYQKESDVDVEGLLAATKVLLKHV